MLSAPNLPKFPDGGLLYSLANDVSLWGFSKVIAGNLPDLHLQKLVFEISVYFYKDLY